MVSSKFKVQSFRHKTWRIRQEIWRTKFKLKAQNSKLYSIIILFIFFGLIGCASVKEAAKCVAGVSTQILEDNRVGAIKEEFDVDYNTCYNKVKEKLKKIKSYIYAEDLKKKLIAVYVSSEDTTPVGIFFKEIDDLHTQIEVASPSTFGKEYIAEEIFAAFDK